MVFGDMAKDGSDSLWFFRRHGKRRVAECRCSGGDGLAMSTTVVWWLGGGNGVYW